MKEDTREQVVSVIGIDLAKRSFHAPDPPCSSLATRSVDSVVSVANLTRVRGHPALPVTVRVHP
jgi:hypothetical protein